MGLAKGTRQWLYNITTTNGCLVCVTVNVGKASQWGPLQHTLQCSIGVGSSIKILAMCIRINILNVCVLTITIIAGCYCLSSVFFHFRIVVHNNMNLLSSSDLSGYTELVYLLVLFSTCQLLFPICKWQ